MYEKEAKKLVEDTFSGAYNEKKFCIFINELAGHASNKLEWRDKTYAGNTLPQSHQEFIESCKYLCRFVDGVSDIGVFVVKLRSIKTLERARSFQRSFIARQLKQFGKEAALVAFYTDDKDNPEWRFSYVRLQYKLPIFGVEEYFTPVHRSSFLVGDTIRQHTAERQLITLLLSSKSMSLALLEEAFSIEPVTNKFFNEYTILYRELLYHLQERIDAGLQFKNKKGEPIEIRAEDFTKHLLGQLVFLYFLQKKRWLGAAKKDYFDNGEPDFLYKLYKKKDYNNFYDDKLTYLLHHALATERYGDNDYYPLFGCKIPYLNGGLFEPFHDYDWQQKLNIRNDIFENIFKVFDTYNFTVHEDETLENEVAIDPEMLGKIFENLIPENERKGSGTFYTPREMVYYMCQESLTDYLHGYFKDSIPREDIGKFIIYCDTMQEHNAVVQEKQERQESSTRYKKFKLPESIKQSASDIDKALQDVRICDPAIGSGAFPVAMMLEITRLRMALDKAILGKELTAYICKRHCIENCLYGVDMEYSAVDIARLRFWLSLTIEEERSDIQKDRVVPLPNLDYKIIHGDALKRTKIDLLNFDRIQKLEKLKLKYFAEGNKERKPELKEKIETGIQALSKGNYDLKLHFSEVFHGDNPGFDIILANPPYIQLQNDSGKLGDIYEKYGYASFARSGDIYALFYERAIDLLNEGGVLAYITSNKWMRANYGKELRNFFTTQTTPIVLLDLGADAFETAAVDTSILITKKGQESLSDTETITFRAAILHDHKRQDSDLYRYMQDTEKIPIPENDEQWRILSDAERVLLKKIESIGTPFKDWDDIDIFRGIVTGYDKAFIIDGKTKARLITEDPKSEELIKPVLRGRDLKKWQPVWHSKWLITTFPSLKIDIDNYPAIKNHLLDFGKSRLEQTGAAGARKKTPHKWFETTDQINYYKHFQKEKIIYPELNANFSFIHDTDNFYPLKTNYIITSDSVNLKNLTTFLHSHISKFWLIHNCSSIGNNGICMFKIYFENLPAHEKINDCHELGAIADAITKDEDIQKHEARLNQILYDMYDLTDAEIEILEKTTQSITT